MPPLAYCPARDSRALRAASSYWGNALLSFWAKRRTALMFFLLLVQLSSNFNSHAEASVVANNYNGCSCCIENTVCEDI
eukprot:5869525-Pyramimonas_sp.AAC.1